jgi:hypothetical protein
MLTAGAFDTFHSAQHQCVFGPIPTLFTGGLETSSLVFTVIFLPSLSMPETCHQVLGEATTEAKEVEVGLRVNKALEVIESQLFSLMN